MRCTVCATDAELAERGDVLVAHIRDLQEAAQARVEQAGLAKSQLTIKAHPHVAVTQMRRAWVEGYRAQMQAMVAEMATYLHSLPDAPDLEEGATAQAPDGLPGALGIFSP